MAIGCYWCDIMAGTFAPVGILIGREGRWVTMPSRPRSITIVLANLSVHRRPDVGVAMRGDGVSPDVPTSVFAGLDHG